MKRRSLLVGSALLCLFAWAEPSFAQYSTRCIEFCRDWIVKGAARYNRCLHVQPICTGHAVAKGPTSKYPAGKRGRACGKAERHMCSPGTCAISGARDACKLADCTAEHCRH